MFSKLVNTQNKQAQVLPLLNTVGDKEDASLVASAKSGDGQAFEVLVRRYERRILHTAMRFTRNQADAEDVVQQSFEKAFIHLQQFEGNSTFSTWITRIAINEALMWLRKRRASLEVPIEESTTEDGYSLPIDSPDPGPSPEDSYSQREWGQILSRAMNELKPGTRNAIRLRHLSELSTDETAGVMRLSVSAVKARLFHGRKKLQAKLKRYVQFTRSQGNRAMPKSIRTRRVLREELACSACD